MWADSHSQFSRSSLLASPVSPVLASSYIVNGAVVRAHSHPYMAALYVGEKHFCGGSLIRQCLSIFYLYVVIKMSAFAVASGLCQSHGPELLSLLSRLNYIISVLP